MDATLVSMISIFVACLVCSGHQLYYKGMAKGATGAVEYLVNNGFLDLEDGDEVEVAIEVK